MVQTHICRNPVNSDWAPSSFHRHLPVCSARWGTPHSLSLDLASVLTGTLCLTSEFFSRTYSICTRPGPGSSTWEKTQCPKALVSISLSPSLSLVASQLLNPIKVYTDRGALSSLLCDADSSLKHKYPVSGSFFQRRLFLRED